MSKTLNDITTSLRTRLPLSAQELPDTVRIFRFASDREMFYTPRCDNDTKLARPMLVGQRSVHPAYLVPND